MAEEPTHTLLWVPHEQDAWVPAKHISTVGDIVTVEENGQRRKISLQQLGGAELVPVNPSSLACIEENLVDLEELAEGPIIHQLRVRLLQDNIYTYVGAILIAVNPYERLPIYGPDVLMKYRAVTPAEPSSPHVYAIASGSYHAMIANRTSQSVLISGESGAGKTETTKKVLSFLSDVAGHGQVGEGAAIVPIEQQIMQSNPILESFGNARTSRNDNSSRFGKWMEVNFDSQHKIQGARIVNYLLEKSRICNPAAGERSYHIFYMLLRGTTADEIALFELQPLESYNYLNQSGCIDVAHRDDAVEYVEMRQAMDELHFPDELQEQCLAVVSAVLHLGNVAFGSDDTKGEDGSKVMDQAVVSRVATQLLCGPEDLESALTHREVSVGGEVLTVALAATTAAGTRDALAKFLYASLFDWLVNRVNGTLFKGESPLNIGVLDIFGFEVFEVNSFEQLCINFANEKLQNHFNTCIFDLELKMYASEGIPIENISFVDNKPCLTLIEGKPRGILAMLDEEVLVPRGSDDGFASKCHKAWGGDFKSGGSSSRRRASSITAGGAPSSLKPLSASPVPSEYYSYNPAHASKFSIRHFAGEVRYETAGFLEKNKDSVPKMALRVVSTCENPLAASFAQAALDTDSPQPRGGRRRVSTLGSQFKSQLSQLMKQLKTTEARFIRCLKPNSVKQPRVFEGTLVLNQLRCAGLFEAIRIRRAGYAVRMPVSRFLQRFSLCVPLASAPTTDGDQGDGEQKTESDRARTEELLPGFTEIIVAAHGRPDDIQLGKTKVFLQTRANLAALEVVRCRVLRRFAVTIQRMARGTLVRRRLHVVFQAIAHLKEAVDAGEADAVEEALADGDRAAATAGVCIPQLAVERERLEYQRAMYAAQQAATEDIEVALAMNHTDAVGEAVSRARTIESSLPPPLRHRVRASISLGEQHLEMGRKRAKATNALRVALKMARGSASLQHASDASTRSRRLRQAVKAAEEVGGLEAVPEFQQAKAHVRREDAELVDFLRSALASRHPAELSAALTTAAAVPHSEQLPEVVAARALLQEVHREGEALRAVDDAMAQEALMDKIHDLEAAMATVDSLPGLASHPRARRGGDALRMLHLEQRTLHAVRLLARQHARMLRNSNTSASAWLTLHTRLGRVLSEAAAAGVVNPTLDQAEVLCESCMDKCTSARNRSSLERASQVIQARWRGFALRRRLPSLRAVHDDVISAIASRDEAGLHAALLRAGELLPLEVHGMALGETMLYTWRVEERVVKALRVAIDGGSVPRLDAAVRMADEQALAHLKEAQVARAMAQVLRRREAVTATLTSLMARPQYDLSAVRPLAEAVAEADKVSLTGPLRMRAERRLEHTHRVLLLRQTLRKAVATADAPALQAALQAAEAAGLLHTTTPYGEAKDDPAAAAAASSAAAGDGNAGLNGTARERAASDSGTAGVATAASGSSNSGGGGGGGFCAKEVRAAQMMLKMLSFQDQMETAASPAPAAAAAAAPPPLSPVADSKQRQSDATRSAASSGAEAEEVAAAAAAAQRHSGSIREAVEAVVAARSGAATTATIQNLVSVVGRQQLKRTLRVHKWAAAVSQWDDGDATSPAAAAAASAAGSPAAAAQKQKHGQHKKAPAAKAAPPLPPWRGSGTLLGKGHAKPSAAVTNTPARRRAAARRAAAERAKAKRERAAADANAAASAGTTRKPAVPKQQHRRPPSSAAAAPGASNTRRFSTYSALRGTAPAGPSPTSAGGAGGRRSRKQQAAQRRAVSPPKATSPRQSMPWLAEGSTPTARRKRRQQEREERLQRRRSRRASLREAAASESQWLQQFAQQSSPIAGSPRAAGREQ